MGEPEEVIANRAVIIILTLCVLADVVIILMGGLL
jgi:hypothetical protein